MPRYTRYFIFAVLLFLVIASAHGFAADQSISGPDGSIEISGANPTPAHMLYGQNYWCWDAYNDDIHGTAETVRGLRLNVVRAGGYNLM